MLHWCSLYIPHCRYESGACESLEVECPKIPDHRHPLPPPLSQLKDCLRYCNIFVVLRVLKHRKDCRTNIVAIYASEAPTKLELIYYRRVLNHLQIAPLLLTTEARRGRECTHASMVLSSYMPHWQIGNPQSHV